jgi:hypothetical protein
MCENLTTEITEKTGYSLISSVFSVLSVVNLIRKCN